MPFPKNFSEMKGQGYIFDNDAKCRDCKSDIEWWITPAGKKMPMNPMPTDLSHAQSHWATCPNAANFRKRT